MLVDSNIIIGAAKRPGAGLRVWLLGQPVIEASAVSRVETLGFPELDAEEGEIITAIFNRATLLRITDPIVERAITLRRRRRIKLGDALIAVTALVHKLPLATRNTDDFAWIVELQTIDLLST